VLGGVLVGGVVVVGRLLVGRPVDEAGASIVVIAGLATTTLLWVARNLLPVVRDQGAAFPPATAGEDWSVGRVLGGMTLVLGAGFGGIRWFTQPAEWADPYLVLLLAGSLLANWTLTEQRVWCPAVLRPFVGGGWTLLPLALFALWVIVGDAFRVPAVASIVGTFLGRQGRRLWDAAERLFD
jgi:hypothetical protein